jgi:glyoxylase-like metal-dependent hydrolase (beta-lactamase superfamily II)
MDAVLIDAGPHSPPFLDELAALIAGRVIAILLTHGHPDHAGGAAYLSSLLNVPVWASPHVNAEVRAGLPHLNSYADHETFDLGTDRVGVVPTPGHAPDHVCFVLEPDQVVFSGDAILGRGTTLIALPEGNMAEYLRTLERMRSLEATLIAPGHGPIIVDPEAKIDEDFAHRRQREQALLEALWEPRTVEELVESIYAPAGDDLRSLAELSVEAQLAKLVDESAIERNATGRYRIRAVS